MNPQSLVTYEQYYALEAEGHRIGIMKCLRCGAAVILDDGADAGKLHDDWHAKFSEGDMNITPKESV